MERVIRKKWWWSTRARADHRQGRELQFDALIEAARRWGARWTVLAAEVRFEREEAPNPEQGAEREAERRDGRWVRA